jgi:hypothetical protein
MKHILNIYRHSGHYMLAGCAIKRSDVINAEKSKDLLGVISSTPNRCEFFFWTIMAFMLTPALNGYQNDLKWVMPIISPQIKSRWLRKNIVTNTIFPKCALRRDGTTNLIQYLWSGRYQASIHREREEVATKCGVTDKGNEPIMGTVGTTSPRQRCLDCSLCTSNGAEGHWWWTYNSPNAH